VAVVAKIAVIRYYEAIINLFTERQRHD